MRLRNNHLANLKNNHFDVLIIGSGINGAVSAASLAARGCKVALVDMGDFGSFTSQESSNLVWGGIKYLENLEFGLVRKLCRSRNHLLDSYPSMIHESRFLSPVENRAKLFHSLPALWCGTWLYWFMGNGYTKRPAAHFKSFLKKEEPVLQLDSCYGGIEYSDARLVEHDTRFVFNFVRKAMAKGAIAVNYCKVLKSEKNEKGWISEVEDQISGDNFAITSSLIINAAGPFVDQINKINKVKSGAKHVFSKGVHLIVPRLAKSKERVLTFFDDQDRLFFVIPLGPVSVVGTTDTPVEDADSEVTDDDIKYILENINKRLDLSTPLSKQDIISTRCGVRPLAMENQEGSSETNKSWFNLSRKHILDIKKEEKYLSIYGGKLTDCLNVGVEIAEEVTKFGITLSPDQKDWYGEPSIQKRDEFFKQADHLNLEQYAIGDTYEPLKNRLWRRYGLDAFKLLDELKNDNKNGVAFIEGAAYLKCELDLVQKREMITKLEDFLRRRTRSELILGKKGLAASPDLSAICEIFFGKDLAEEKLKEYTAH